MFSTYSAHYCCPIVTTTSTCRRIPVDIAVSDVIRIISPGLELHADKQACRSQCVYSCNFALQRSRSRVRLADYLYEFSNPENSDCPI